jgi:uncharacterized OB-fold protein
VAPQPDEESAAFWAAVKEHRLELQRCNACGRVRFPPMPGCPYCGALGHDTTEATGSGTLYSWVVVHVPLTPSAAAEVPYTIGTITLEEGCRMVARIDGDPALRDGLALAATYVDHADWTEVRFAAEGR